jgi:NADH-quinone oxidoreductase subunit J
LIFEAILFYLFAAVLLGAALGVVFARNPVHSVMFLVLTFFNSAILWLMAEAEFLAIVLVLVYVGAVMVLFLFVIMMLEVNIEAVKRGLTRYAPLAVAIALVMMIELVQLIWWGSRGIRMSSSFTPNPEGYDNTITLTMRKRPGLKVQNIAKQVAVRAKDRIRVVKMDAEKKQ